MRLVNLILESLKVMKVQVLMDEDQRIPSRMWWVFSFFFFFQEFKSSVICTSILKVFLFFFWTGLDERSEDEVWLVEPLKQKKSNQIKSILQSTFSVSLLMSLMRRIIEKRAVDTSKSLPTYHPRSWSHRSWYKINTHTHTHLIIIIIIWLFFNITFIFQEHLKICSIHWVSFPTPASSLAIRLYMYRREQSDDFQRKGYRSTT